MYPTHKQATLTAKGRVTLPKAIREALGVSAGAKVNFEIREGQVIVFRADVAHEDPAISAILDLLEKDISQGKHVGTLPNNLALAMLANRYRSVDLEEDINGEVIL